MKVLIVEDSNTLALMWRQILEDAGHQVINAYDGLTGLEAINTEEPDAVLLDIMLPDIDGEEILDRLSKDRVAKVVVLTGINQYRANKLLEKFPRLPVLDKPTVKPAEVLEVLTTISQGNK